MDIFFPSLTTAGLITVVLWLSKNLIVNRLKCSVEYEFSTRLEELRQELKNSEEKLKHELNLKESELRDLRNGVLGSVAARQAEYDKRRLAAIDQIWSAFIALAPARNVSSVVSKLNIDAINKVVADREKLNKFISGFAGDVSFKSVLSDEAHKSRPFLSPMAWALFRAYQSIVLQDVIRLECLKKGLGPKAFVDNAKIDQLLKIALPDDCGSRSGNRENMLEELETRLLDELHKIATGSEEDELAANRAAKIISLSNELRQSSSKASSVASV
ncbi:hypothetical protein [Billgrantia kenyensis]|uniref:Uncharacterized protein n=1 Tax=Billgrantia kenyensis TaxID=321266 RepID=A0A7W0AF76_9GAMM|nr:hypothetical protein [Halomonas kenyensis]MBA2781101.1 hypothetical protein [Halomonas kenyensis]MCG6663814.1 hypothetical protein [Halomonas kenyensis]